MIKYTKQAFPRSLNENETKVGIAHRRSSELLMTIRSKIAPIALSALAIVSCFPPKWSKVTGYDVAPSMIRNDCTGSDECCVIFMHHFFDMLPFKSWDRSLGYPAESWAAKPVRPKRKRETTIYINDVLMTIYHDVSACIHRCRDIRREMIPSKYDVRSPLWSVIIQCNDNQIVGIYKELSLNPGYRDSNHFKHTTKCKCIPITIELEQAMKSGFKPMRIKIAQGETDCIELKPPINTPQSPRDLSNEGIALLASLLEEDDEDPSSLSGPMVAESSWLSEKAWTEITDICTGHTEHQIGPSHTLPDVAIDHAYQVCAHAPENQQADFWASYMLDLSRSYT